MFLWVDDHQSEVVDGHSHIMLTDGNELQYSISDSEHFFSVSKLIKSGKTVSGRQLYEDDTIISIHCENMKIDWKGSYCIATEEQIETFRVALPNYSEIWDLCGRPELTGEKVYRPNFKFELDK